MPFVASNYDLPREQKDLLGRAERLERLSIAFLLSIMLALGLTMGNSQAMKTLWLEDLLSLVPSIAFLLGCRFRRKEPNEEYPYGYRRAIIVAFLAGAVALFGLGTFMLLEAVVKLIEAEHPTIQSVELFGTRVWLGWLMIAALVYSVIPPFILGRMKYELAHKLHDKALYTSGHINKGDWLAGLAGIAGILGVAYGWWWADSAAAAFISFEIIKDGVGSLKDSTAQLLNRRPRDMESDDVDPLPQKLKQAFESLDWVREARVRLREDGDILTGEAFIVPRDETNLLEKLERAGEMAESFHWRIHDVMLVPVRSL